MAKPFLFVGDIIIHTCKLKLTLLYNTYVQHQNSYKKDNAYKQTLHLYSY